MSDLQVFGAIVLFCLVLGVFMLNYLEEGKLLRPYKWEIYQENVSMTAVGFNPIWGNTTKEYNVPCDVYRKMRRNGAYKYKTVRRS
jgi:hypothetical protein